MTQSKPIGQVNTAYARIFAAAALWGIIGVWNRALMARGLSPTQIVAVRNFGGMLVLSAYFAFRDRSVFRIRPGHLKYFLGTGIVSVVFFTVCYFSCQTICSLAVSSILLYTAPSFVVILAAILWKEPITRRKMSALALTFLGCALVCGIFGGNLTVTPAGILYGLGAGFFYALYSIFGRYALAHYPPVTVTVWTFLTAGPVSLLFLIPTGDAVSSLEIALISNPAAASFSPEIIPLGLGLVLFSTVLPYLFYTGGLSKVESGKASILASLEPVVASLAGVVLFHEPMSILTVCGIVCVLSGVWILR